MREGSADRCIFWHLDPERPSALHVAIGMLTSYAMATRTVLISGAGISGPTLAYWLNKSGFKPTLVEHAPTPRSGGYVIDFWGLGYDIAERMGLHDELERLGYHMQELRIVNDEGRRTAGFGVSVFRELAGGRFVTVRRLPACSSKKLRPLRKRSSVMRS